MLDFETEYIESARPFQRIVNSYRNVVLTNKGNIALFVVTYLHTYRYEHERDKQIQDDKIHDRAFCGTKST